MKVSFECNQIPLFFSRTRPDALRPRRRRRASLRIDDAIQSGIQNGTTHDLAAAIGQAQPFDLRLKRSIADFKADLQRDARTST